jgi:hypothetical protein
VVERTINGERVPFVEDLPPLWAADAMTSKKTVMIVFEEMNRNLKLVNGMLNILNERRIGYKILFDNAECDVLFAATGNLGEEDDTVVEEFDAAQWGRLIRVKQVMKGEEGRSEWDSDFASVPTEQRPKGHVLPLMREFLKANPEQFAPRDKKKDGLTVDGRRWTYLNEYLVTNAGYDGDIEEYLQLVQSAGPDYVGSHAVAFIEFLNNRKRFTVADVLAGRDMKVDRDNAAQLIDAIHNLDWSQLTDAQSTNIIKFVKATDREMQAAFLIDHAERMIRDYVPCKFYPEREVTEVWTKIKPHADKVRNAFKGEYNMLQKQLHEDKVTA